MAGLSAGSAQPDKAHAYPLATLATQTWPKSPSTTARPLRSFRALRAHPPLEQRGPGQLIDYTAATLDKSFAVYREGDRDQAYDLSVAAYLEGFELVESSLDNVDADLRRSTEKQLMAYRQALRDGLPEAQVAQQLELAKGKLAEAAKQLGGDSLSFSISFVSALLILLREGVEQSWCLPPSSPSCAIPGRKVPCVACTSAGGWPSSPASPPGRWPPM